MKLIIDNFLGGISSSDRMGKPGSYYLGEQADPLREIGYLIPGFKGANIATSNDDPVVLTNYINAFTIDAKNSKVYGIEHSPEIQQISALTLLITDNDPTTFPHTIGDDLTGHGGHASFVGEDVIIYPIGTTHYLFYSWNDDNDGDVGKVALSGSLTFEDDNLSNTVASGAVLLKGVPHPMIEFQENGMLYIANGRDLVEIDGQTGANGTADMTAFRLPVGWIIKALFNAGELLGICAEYLPGTYATDLTRRKRVAVFFWDGVDSTKFVRQISIPDTEITAAINVDGIPHIFCTDIRAIGIIRAWNGVTFIKVQEINLHLGYVDKAPISYGGVSEYKNGILFSTTLGRLAYYGSLEPGLPKALYQIAMGETIDSITKAYGVTVVDRYEGTIINSCYDDSIHYLQKFYTTTYNADFVYKSLYYEFPQKIRINYIKVHFQTLASGADDDIKIETDYGNVTTALGSISESVDGAVEHKRFDRIITCDNFRIIIDTDEANSTTAIKYARIVVDYDLIEADL